MKKYENDYVYLADRIKKKDRIHRELSPKDTVLNLMINVCPDRFSYQHNDFD